MIQSISLSGFSDNAGAVLHGSAEGVRINGLAIDSRAVKAGDLFAAIPGARVDGHDFVATAARSGAAAALVQRVVDVDIPQVVTTDTEAAVAVFGRLAREDFDGVLVGITGSAGKTTAKNLIAAVLSRAGRVLATEGNRNNELGVPLTLASLEPTTEFAVLEMGAGKPGDIAYLQAIVRPTVAVLLNVAEAHIEHYGSVDAIAETKGAILEGLDKNGLAVINGDEPWTDAWRGRAAPASVVTFGFGEGNDFRAVEIVQKGFDGSEFLVESPRGRFAVSLQLPGRQGAFNALAAFAVGESLGVSPSTIAKGLQSVEPASGRGRVHSLANAVSLVDDSYNANPMAMMAAIDVLATVSAPRYLVMGAMLELGQKSAELHAKIGAYARECGIEQLWVVGDAAWPAAEAFGRGARCFEDCAAVCAVESPFESGATVLVKASRGSALDVLVSHWLAEGGDAC